jgi:hypothetical protein
MPTPELGRRGLLVQTRRGVNRQDVAPFGLGATADGNDQPVIIRTTLFTLLTDESR